MDNSIVVGRKKSHMARLPDEGIRILEEYTENMKKSLDINIPKQDAYRKFFEEAKKAMELKERGLLLIKKPFSENKK